MNPYERITHVGGLNPNGGRWKKTKQQVIREIDAGEWVYYVGETALTKVKVITALSPYGNKYIKTEADGQEPNNLLSLQECP